MSDPSQNDSLRLKGMKRGHPSSQETSGGAAEDGATEDIGGPSPAKRSAFSSAEASNGVPAGNVSSAAESIMRRMGHQVGKGLGKQGQGIVKPVEAVTIKGRAGFGFATSSSRPDFKWKEGDDPVVIDRAVDWLPRPVSRLEVGDNWLTIDDAKMILDDETNFVNEEVLRGVLECKTFLDTMGNRDLMDSRSRSNPYETVKNAIFMNRAALKMAEMDAVLKFALSRPHDNSEGLLHFADICAGPGGFTEYLLWRNRTQENHGPRAKGYGLTLKGPCDFKLTDMLVGSPEFFHPYYGPEETSDGDIYEEKNMLGFRALIMADTEGLGVHLLTADGGFSVEGQENIQEIRSKQLYLCQCLTALLTLREGGSFVCKLFDVFTEFSAGLMYLLNGAFDQFALFKPATSRPANSERYVICRGYRRSESAQIVEYMLHANREINRLKLEANNLPPSQRQDVQGLVPLELIKSNASFTAYLTKSNNQLGRWQIVGLSKIHHFFDNNGMRDPRQEQTRLDCLNFWGIPDEQRGRTIGDKQEPTIRIDSLLSESKMDALLPAKARPDGPPLTMEAFQKDCDYLPFDYQALVTGSTADVALVFSRGNNSVMLWSRGKSKWSSVDSKALHFAPVPRDTILLVQSAQEYRPPGFQLKETCLHVIDCPLMQGCSLLELPFEERLARIRQLCRCVNFAGVPGRKRLRVLRSFEAHELLTDSAGSLRCHLARVQVKGNKMPRAMMRQENGYVFAPAGLFLFRNTKDPWRRNLSRKSGKLYFYHKDGKEPTAYESQQRFFAAFHDQWASAVWVPFDASGSSSIVLDLKALQKLTDGKINRPVLSDYSLTSVDN